MVVEDQMMVAYALKDILTSVGMECVGPFGTANEAIDYLQADGCDFALLDINLGPDSTSEPVAEALIDQNIPFAFVTGYGSAAPIDNKFGHIDRYQKPIHSRDVIAAIKTA